jgi:hypothetical protein
MGLLCKREPKTQLCQGSDVASLLKRLVRLTATTTHQSFDITHNTHRRAVKPDMYGAKRRQENGIAKMFTLGNTLRTRLCSRPRGRRPRRRICKDCPVRQIVLACLAPVLRRHGGHHLRCFIGVVYDLENWGQRLRMILVEMVLCYDLSTRGVRRRMACMVGAVVKDLSI